MSRVRRWCCVLAIAAAVAAGVAGPSSPAEAIPALPVTGSRASAVASADGSTTAPPVATSRTSGPEEAQNTPGVVAGVVLVGGWIAAVSLSLARSRRRRRGAR